MRMKHLLSMVEFILRSPYEFGISHILIYYINTSVLLEYTQLEKFGRNHIRDSGGVFPISSPIKVSMTSLISCLTL